MKTLLLPPKRPASKVKAWLPLLKVGLVAGLVGFSLIAASPALAERLESNSYVIQFGNFNITSGEKSSASYNVTDTVGQTGAGPFAGSSYNVGAGFQYIYAIGEFRFSLSQTAIDLGDLVIGEHSTGSHNVFISTKGAGGYTVYAYELHPLRHSNGTDEIPDTTCDTAACDQTNADPWTDTDIPGFGFNIQGDSVPADFVDSTYFRQFADNEATETMQTVMSSANVTDGSTATVTYKAGIDANQTAGNYQTAVVYIAVPGY